jgi:hypothetical protein
MTLILNIVSSGWILALIVSATITTAWIARRLFDAMVRLYLAIAHPETRRARKKVQDPNPHQLKRAGQW